MISRPGTPGRKPIHPQYLAKLLLSEHASEDAVFTCDVGTPTIWTARYIAMNGKRRIIGSFNHGSMANALPQAIGAQSAYPGRQVISMLRRWRLRDDDGRFPDPGAAKAAGESGRG